MITWANPADITYGTALSATQLNATADVAGTFAYMPVAGTVLNAGPGQALKVDFIESIFHISPDGGSGLLELLLFAVPIVGASFLIAQRWLRRR